MAEVELKKCPFCGREGTVIIRKGKNGWRDRYAVLCDYEHGGCGAESGWYHYEEEAIEAWNRRDDGRIAFLEEIMKGIYEIDDCLYNDDYANGYNAAINKVIDVVNKVAGVKDGRK